MFIHLKENGLVSQNMFLIYLILFILTIIISKILIDQFWLANRNRNSSKSLSENTYFDTLCYECLERSKNQMFSLVESQNELKFSNQSGLIDKQVFTVKGLINQSKSLLNFWLALFKYRFFRLENFLEEIQAKKINVLKLYFSQDNLQFTRGLVLGEKSPEASFYPDFTNAGMLHVLVASGFNVALVAGAARRLTRFFSRKMQLTLILAVVWTYVILLKFQPPLLRAAWMFSLVFLLKFLGQKTQRVRVLAWSVVIILSFQPALVASLSLWLSVLATLGIMVFSRRLSLFWQEGWPKNGEPQLKRVSRIFLEEGAVSLSAQALIFPLLIWFFHSLNLVSFLANPLLLPWIGGITQAAGLQFLLAFFEQYWPVRVILEVTSSLMTGVLRLYLAAVAWWQPWYFLNQTVAEGLEQRYLAIWAGIIGIFAILTRRKREVKTHFFHEKV
ncbi:MAG TPA: hypothetical protein DIV47_04040 [Candidatus Pacebacteria bacterium]|nr:hypothetical protein [Candidatus Paceibacterota bacterium]